MVQYAQSTKAQALPNLSVSIAQKSSKRFVSTGTVDTGFGSAPGVGDLIVVAIDCQGGSTSMVTSMTMGGVPLFSKKASYPGRIEIWVGIKTSFHTDKTVSITLISPYPETLVTVTEFKPAGDVDAFTTVLDGTINGSSQGFNQPFWWTGSALPVSHSAVLSLMTGLALSHSGSFGTPTNGWSESNKYVPGSPGRSIGLFHHIGTNGDSEHTNVSHGSSNCYNVACLLELTVADSSMVLTFGSAPEVNSIIVVAIDASAAGPDPVASVTMGGVSSFTRIADRGSVDGRMELWYGVKTSSHTSKVVSVVLDGPYAEVLGVATEFTASSGAVIGTDGAMTGSGQGFNQPLWWTGSPMSPSASKVLSLMIGAVDAGSYPSTFENPPYKGDLVTPSGWTRANQEVPGSPGRALGMWWHIGSVHTGDEATYVKHNSSDSSNVARMLELDNVVELDPLPIVGTSTVSGGFNYQAKVSGTVNPVTLFYGGATVYSFLEAITAAFSLVNGAVEKRSILSPAAIASQSVFNGYANIVSSLTPTIICNLEPSEGIVQGVGEGTRFSVRDLGGAKREGINVFVGTGPAFYAGGALPEDSEDVDFRFRSLWVNPVGVAERSIELDDSLKIVKGSAGDNLKGVYEFGGLQSPADPDGPLMAEFTLQLAEADTTPDVYDFTGVLFGFKINGLGIHVKFHTAGILPHRTVQIHNAHLSENSAVSPTYAAVYDWDQGAPHTYKILWYPRLDIVRLLVSTGVGTTSDIVLVDGKISDLSALPDLEVPLNEPIAYFGHAKPEAESISYWHKAYLYNIIDFPVVDGVNRGEHVGFIRTNDVVEYQPTATPRLYEQPWSILPASFGTIGGQEWLTVDNRFAMQRDELLNSYGYYRVEPLTAVEPTILDFKVSGQALYMPPGGGQATGMEVYIDDGIKKAVFGMLDSDGTQYVGLYGGGPASDIASYVGEAAAWLVERSYRIIFDPAGVVTLRRFVTAEEGVDEEVLATIAHSGLPSSDMPGPGLGFLINGNTNDTKALMKIGRVRYSVGCKLWESTEVPPAPWTEVGTGTRELSDGLLVTESDSVYIHSRSVPDVDSESGFFLEFRARVNEYIVDGEVDPIRKPTGISALMADGTYTYALMFADAGPELGKIAFILTMEDVDENLLAIRSNDPAVAGTYTQVDWSQMHIYRMEKTVGKRFRVFIDEEDDPVMDFGWAELNVPPGVTKLVAFGATVGGTGTNSSWQFVRYGVSSGYDVKAFPVMNEHEVLSRFGHAFNVIVEGEGL